jgi:hypothetical protein
VWKVLATVSGEISDVSCGKTTQNQKCITIV